MQYGYGRPFGQVSEGELQNGHRPPCRHLRELNAASKVLGFAVWKELMGLASSLNSSLYMFLVALGWGDANGGGGDLQLGPSPPLGHARCLNSTSGFSYM